MIRAVVQTGPRRLELREFPRPVIGPEDGGLLRVEACGICGSDVEQYKGHLSQQWLPMLGTTVLILGVGQRGLAAVLAARAAGAGTIIVTGLARDSFKLSLAREFGADHTIDVDAQDTVSRVAEITGGPGPTWCST